jgi:hypothetical protein
VGWVAGAADPWLAVFLLAGLLLFASALDAERAGWRLAGTTAIFVLAYLAKESAAIGLALVSAWGVAAAWSGGRTRWIPIARRTAAVVIPLAGVFVLYLVMRGRVFGTAFGGYNDLNADRSILLQEIAWFLLRSFFPASEYLVHAWVRVLGLAAIAGAVVALAWMVRRRPVERSGLLFVCAGFVIALLPVVLLTISLTGTTSERFVYVPTVFSCVLIAWTAVVVSRWRIVEVALMGAMLLAQVPAMTRAKVERLAASGVFERFTTEMVALVRAEAPTDATRVFFLTMPDSIGGAVVMRSAFHPALSVLAPEIPDPVWRVTFLMSHNLRSPDDHVTVSAHDGEFRVGLNGRQFIEQRGPAESDDFKVSDWSPSGYAVQFKPVHWRRVIAYFGDGHVYKIDAMAQSMLDAVPFGVIDLPAGDATCTGETVRFAGWALDDQGVTQIGIETADDRGEWHFVTAAERPRETRPDIASGYAGYPDSRNAEWDYYLPCAAAPPSRVLHVRVVAHDSVNHSTVLGERTVRWP